MKRETIIAIVFGVLLGAGAGLVVLFKTSSTDEAKVIPIDAADKKVVSQAPAAGTSQAQFVISEPTDKSVVATNLVTITGSAPLNSLLVVQTPSSEQITKIDAATYSVSVPLALGENVINVSVYAGSSTPQEQVLRIYYVKTP